MGRLLHFSAPQVLKIAVAKRISARDATSAFELRNRSHRPTAIRVKNRNAAPIVIALDIGVFYGPRQPGFDNVEFNLRHYSTTWPNQHKSFLLVGGLAQACARISRDGAANGSRLRFSNLDSGAKYNREPDLRVCQAL